VRDRDDLGSGLRFVGLYFRVSDFGSCVLKEASFQSCVLEKVNLTRAHLLGCQLDESQLIGCEIGHDTRLDGTDIADGIFAGLAVRRPGGTVELYSPAAIISALREHGAVIPEEAVPPPDSVDEAALARVELTERLLKHARTHYYLSRNDSWVRNNLLSEASWDDVERLLKKHGLLSDVKISKSGPAEKFMRLTAPPDVILQARAGGASSPEAASFWSALSHQ